MRVLVAGFPYVRESYFATWRHVPAPDDFRFLLPRRWTAKNGAVVFNPPFDPRVITASAYFHDSHAPLIGGLLKGWMPAFPLVLWRMRRSVGLVYSCSEPILLTTLYQAMWSKLLGKKHVCFTWENIHYEKKFHGLSRLVHSAILRLNLLLSDGLICGNPEGAEIHRHFTRKPIAVIPMNGVDPEQFQRPEARDSHLTPRVVYVFIGAIGKRKGLHVLLKAFPEVLRKIPNAHLIIAGSGEYEPEIKRLTDEPFIREHVTRFPWLSHSEVIRLLSTADVFVYPSISLGGWAEQFGYSMAEASLMELPVISTHSGSIAHVVRDGETGLLVEPNDVGALAVAMVRLGADGELRERLGKAGRAYVAGRYSDEAVARQFTEFFARILT